MRKRGKRDSFICSCTPAGARETTTVTVPKRKSGKRTVVLLSWEVLDPRTWRGAGWVVPSTLVHSLHLPGPQGLSPAHPLTPPRESLSRKTNRPACTINDESSPYVSVRVCVLLYCVIVRRPGGACARKAAGTVAHESERSAARRRRAPRRPRRPPASGPGDAARRLAPLVLRVLCTVVVEWSCTCTPYTPDRKLYWFVRCLDQPRLRYRPQNRFCEERHNWPFSFFK